MPRPGDEHSSLIGRRRAASGSLPGALACFVVALAGGTACAPDVPGTPAADETGRAPWAVELVDASGRVVRLPGPAERIVSLVPSAARTLRALDADDRVIGRTDYDDDPWAAALPSVGGGLDPDLERLVALRPDVVVRFAGEQDPRTPARLDELGIVHVAVRPDRLEDVFRTIEILAQLTGLEARGDSLARALRTGLDQVRDAVAGRPERRVAYVLGGNPPWVAGPGTYIDELLTLVGAENVFADQGALYGSVSPEQVRSRRIDVVLVSGYDTFNRSLTPDAVVRDVEPEVEIPGPDIVRSAWRLAELVHGPLSPDSAGLR